jgi:hypothetical protein
MTENKKEWVTPELIILVRSKPEEAVLGGCKVFTETNYGASGIYATCSITACLTPCTGITGS